MTTEAKVNTAELKGLAGAMRGVFWYQPEARAMPPDQLPLAVSAAANLNSNAEALQQHQKIAEAEGHRLGEMLDSAAAAYDEVDEKYKTTLDDPQRHSAVEAITLRPPSTPLPPLPDGPSAPESLDGGGYSNIEQTQALLLSGNEASLRSAAVEWGLAADSADGARPMRDATDWEGEAADAAHKRLNDYGDWCTDLGAAWRRLAEAATQVADAHVTALTEHTPLFLRYEAAKEAIARLLAEGGPKAEVQAQAVQAEMVKLQQQSDEVRQNYAGHATFDQVKVREPGFAGRGGSGGSSSGGSGGGSGGGGGNPAAGGGQSAGASSPPSAPASSQGMEPMSAGQSPSESSSGSGGSPSGSGGSPSGKGGSSSGGGSPAGGGLPGGGLPDGGVPDLGLDDPGVSPAAAGAGGGGSGAGAGGGGGAPALPLQPSVGAETVGPAAGARGGGAGAIPAAAMGGGGMAGGMGGGMGGMGHGAGGAQQGKEKRRDPNLSPDEELYTEDRPWTEGVIGARRRRDTPDKDQK
ncbi:MAG: hypothetical protein HYZ39_03535 [Mycolicibacterium cosmeticum]|nr:hypothetical protein [Mycolicibacterium cosmeticum]